MGASGKWLQSLISVKKQEKDKHVWEKVKGKKWKLIRSSSGELGSGWKGFKNGRRAASEIGSDDFSSLAGDYHHHHHHHQKSGFNAAVAKVIRAQPKDFKVVRQEWATIRIQPAFHAFSSFE